MLIAILTMLREDLEIANIRVCPIIVYASHVNVASVRECRGGPGIFAGVGGELGVRRQSVTPCVSPHSRLP